MQGHFKGSEFEILGDGSEDRKWKFVDGMEDFMKTVLYDVTGFLSRVRQQHCTAWGVTADITNTLHTENTVNNCHYLSSHPHFTLLLYLCKDYW